MMSGYLTKEEFIKNRSKFTSVGALITSSDVATVVETLETVLREYPSSRIVDVVQDENKYYYCVIGKSEESTFDFYTWLKAKYRSSAADINCVNIKLLFPLSLSRGINQNPSLYDIEDDTEDEDENATGFMDEDEIDDAVFGTAHRLVYVKNNRDLKIPQEGISIGRSSKRSDFVLKDNENVSRLHCKVYREGKQFKVRDEKSKNGTYVNGLKVAPGVDVNLNVGDTLLVADEEFKLI